MNRVLLICHDMVGPRMAGPAIRFWEFARVLGRQFEVTLAIPGGTELGPEGFRLLPYPASSTSASSWEELEREAKGHADVVIVSGHQVLHMPFLHSLDVPLVADLWIPLPVESLAWHAFDERPQQVAAYHDAWRATEAVARCADFVLVASERQRDYWLGVLTAFGRLHPDTYSRDSDVRDLVDLVPVGCPAEPPQPSRAIRGVWPGIGTQDRVILWTSGVWNWFDPLTLLRAMPQVAARHPEARLVFIGVRHPDAARIPEMETARIARELSQRLHLDGRHVFWGGWVPYAERGAYLLDADVGVSLHRTGLEPRYAYRARLLDAVWAGLPMVLTGGDVLAELLERRGLSTTVLPYDVDGVANALVAFLDEEDTRSQRKPAFDSLRAACCWEQAAEPLVRFCHTPRIDAAKADAMTLTGSLKDMAAQAAPGDSAAALRDQVARLQEIVRGYEAGRVMRLMRTLRLGRRGSSR